MLHGAAIVKMGYEIGRMVTATIIMKAPAITWTPGTASITPALPVSPVCVRSQSLARY